MSSRDPNSEPLPLVDEPVVPRPEGPGDVECDGEGDGGGEGDELLPIMSEARSLADSASDCTFSLPVSTEERADSIIESLREEVVCVVPYSSHWLRLARRRAITAPAAPTTA